MPCILRARVDNLLLASFKEVWCLFSKTPCSIKLQKPQPSRRALKPFTKFSQAKNFKEVLLVLFSVYCQLTCFGLEFWQDGAAGCYKQLMPHFNWLLESIKALPVDASVERPHFDINAWNTVNDLHETSWEQLHHGHWKGICKPPCNS